MNNVVDFSEVMFAVSISINYFGEWPNEINRHLYWHSRKSSFTDLTKYSTADEC